MPKEETKQNNNKKKNNFNSSKIMWLAKAKDRESENQHKCQVDLKDPTCGFYVL